MNYLIEILGNPMNSPMLVEADKYREEDGWVNFYNYGEEYDHPVCFLTRETRWIKMRKEKLVASFNSKTVICISKEEV